jgi:hypothetical protein
MRDGNPGARGAAYVGKRLTESLHDVSSRASCLCILCNGPAVTGGNGPLRGRDARPR